MGWAEAVRSMAAGHRGSRLLRGGGLYHPLRATPPRSCDILPLPHAFRTAPEPAPRPLRLAGDGGDLFRQPSLRHLAAPVDRPRRVRERARAADPPGADRDPLTGGGRDRLRAGGGARAADAPRRGSPPPPLRGARRP